MHIDTAAGAVPKNTNPAKPIRIAIVDPSSAGYFIARRALERGFLCAAIFSSPSCVISCDIDFAWTRERTESDFDASIASDAYDAIIPGAESGVQLAEELASLCGLAGNNPQTTAWRRNKNAMAQALRAAGIALCRQQRCRSLAESADWAQANGYPVVVKPEASSGSDLVRVCQTPDALLRHASIILGQADRYGQNTQAVLVQELMAGEEYTVDGVVADGVLRFFAVGKYRKINRSGALVYDKIDFFAPKHPAVDPSMLAYCQAVAKAVGVRVGPVHIEIMLTAQGPLLVEIAARAHGGIGASVIDAHFSPSFIDAIIDSYLPGLFHGVHRDTKISQKRPASIAFLISDRSGKLLATPGAERIHALASFVRSRWVVTPGEEISKTVDLPTCPALVELSHKDPRVVEADIARIREWERSGLIWEIA